MEVKELGKITNVSFGLCGYQDCCIGIKFTLEGKGWGVCDEKSGWDANLIKCTDRCKWTEEDRSESYNKIIRCISNLLRDAKVDDISKLKNIPVEVVFDNNTLKSWSILTEVL